jgi:hypothetical protein
VQLSATVPSSDVSRRSDTTNLVVNCPRPPSLREKLVNMVGDVFLPLANGGAGQPPWWTWVWTALQFLFPVLKWGRSYSLKSFRSDIMAGLTLASLGIPQVRYECITCCRLQDYMPPDSLYAWYKHHWSALSRMYLNDHTFVSSHHFILQGWRILP